MGEDGFEGVGSGGFKGDYGGGKCDWLRVQRAHLGRIANLLAAFTLFTRKMALLHRNVPTEKSVSNIWMVLKDTGARSDGSRQSREDRQARYLLRRRPALEICGPNQEHFSIVDVPGIFRKTTEGVTTNEDQAMVTAMVRRYMENPRSIMLAVIPANVDIATQEILTMAEEVDKDGHRTLGVLTKPDLVDSGAEQPVLDLVQGKRHQLALGWCIVRNLGQRQLQDANSNRDQIEQEIFRWTYPRNALDQDRIGIASLRLRLQEILANKIRKDFKIVSDEPLSGLLFTLFVGLEYTSTRNLGAI